jgi:hypothetical protein
MFQTSGTIDTAMLKKIRPYLYPRRFNLTMPVLAGMMGALSAFRWHQGNARSSTGLLVLAVGILVAYITSSRRAVHDSLQAIRRLTGRSEYDVTTVFKNDGIHVSGQGGHARIILSYDAIRHAVFTAEHGLLFSKDHQMAIVFLDQLTASEQSDLAVFLKERGLSLTRAAR